MRAITKGGFQTTAYIFDMTKMGDEHTAIVDNQTIVFTNIMTFSGRKSENLIRTKCAKDLGHTNFLITGTTYEERDSITLDADTFFENSEICDPDTSYGAGFVTATFKITFGKIAYMKDGTMHFDTYFYDDVTTPRKFLNAARARYENENLGVIGKLQTLEIRRYMERTKFEALAKPTKAEK